MDKFKHLKLSKGILESIRSAGFDEPSEIQEKTIPLALEGKDIIGNSATGSGKTLAFAAGIIDMTTSGGGVQALIMTPTRELAEQVAETFRKFSSEKRLKVKQIYGGVGMDGQIHDLRRADIVVGTPGRLLDHLKRRTLNLSKVKHLVLDEADRMLDMGFIRDAESIVKLCPQDRQTLLFSATMSSDIDYLAKKYMKNPVGVSAGERVDPSKLYQIYYDVIQEMKFSLLTFLLKREKEGVVMVFCKTRRNTDKLTRSLNSVGLHALAIHGGLSQNRRNGVLQAFHSKETLILVCTDVAARGLDIKDVSHVYNYDLPNGGSDYVHRIGRTARAGKNGIAISFVSSGFNGEFRQIMKEAKVNIEKEALPKFDFVAVSANASEKKPFRSGGGNRERSGRSRSGGRSGGRFSGGRREGSQGGRRFGGNSSGGRFRTGGQSRERFGGNSSARREGRRESRDSGRSRFGKSNSGFRRR